MDPEFLRTAVLAMAREVVGPVFSEDAAEPQYNETNSSNETLDDTTLVAWSSLVQVEITGFVQTVRSWLTMAGEESDFRPAAADERTMHWALTLALVSAFSLSGHEQVTLTNILGVDGASDRRMRFLQDAGAGAVHINYTIVSGDDISTVVQGDHFFEHMEDALELAAFHYEVDLPPGVLVGTGANSEVETAIDYSVVVPLDAARHDSAALDRELRQVVTDGDTIGVALGNATVLTTRISKVELVDLSPRPNATLPPAQPPPAEPVAAVVLSLLLVLSAIMAFGVLLYRVCMPVWRASRVAPVSKYEWSPPTAKSEAAELQDG
jgi:hypothetical protein